MKRTCFLSAFVIAAGAAQASGLGVADVGVSACRSFQDGQVGIPVIASGADLVTAFANGYETSGSASGPLADLGIDARIVQGDDLDAQVRDYAACDTPFIRATQGQLGLVADAVAGTGAEPVAVFQFGFSNGADAVVTRPGVRNAAGLSGRTVAAHRNGPSLDFLARLLKDGKAQAGDSWEAPTIVWASEAAGMEGDSPAALFLGNEDVAAAFVPNVDAAILTSGGTGTGAEGSVRGARTMLTTRSLNRAVSHVLAVRADYLAENGQQVRDVVQALLNAEERVREDVLKQIVEWEAVSDIFYGSEAFGDDVRAMWSGFETVGLTGNRRWSDPSSSRGFDAINADLAEGLMLAGVAVGGASATVTDWDWDSLGGSLFDTRLASISGFDNEAAGAAVQSMHASGEIGGNTLLEFEITFDANQSEFPVSQYQAQFEQAIGIASAYGGAVITIEGHTEPSRFLVMKYRENQPDSVLKRLLQSALNLSINRAQAVRDALMDHASESGLHLDRSQFVVDGRGVMEPATGLCGDEGVPECPAAFLAGDPAPPRTEEEIAGNRRVVFRMVNVEAEGEVLTPVVSWD